MAIFPGAISSFAGFTSSHTLAADNHAAQHNSEQAEIVATQTKVGFGASTPTNNTVLRGNGTGTSTWAQVNLTTDITGVLPVVNGGTNATTAAVARANLGLNTQSEILQAAFPVGCVYTETTGTNPNSTFGFGTWTAFGAGRVLVGNGTSDQVFTAGATGGESNHTLSTAEMPAHTHATQPGAQDPITSAAATAGTAITSTTNSGTTGSTGGGSSHNNLQPYLVVYFWKRTA